MNKLDKTIEVLNDIVTEDDTEEKERQEALAYLESLKPIVPNEVADRLKEKFGLVLNSKRDYSRMRSRILRGENNE